MNKMWMVTNYVSYGQCRLMRESQMLVRIAVVLAVVAGFGLPGPAGAQEPKAEKSHTKTILFLGDSITAAGGYVRIIEAELAKQPPPNSWKVINRGKGSETVSDLSEAYHPGRRPCLFTRLDKELADAKPDWVVACYGINDGIGQSIPSAMADYQYECCKITSIPKPWRHPENQ